MKKSERTRAAILSASRQSFSERGFEATTIRMIAEAARVDPALVIRYFGNKDALFAQVIEVDLDLPQDLSGAATVGESLVARFLDLWEDDTRGLPILLRAATTNDVAAEKVRSVFAGQIVPFARRLGPGAGAERRAALVVSQLFGFALCRYILRLSPAVAMTREEIIADLAPVLDRHLGR